VDEGGVRAVSAEVQRCRRVARGAAATDRADASSRELAHALWALHEALMAAEQFDEAVAGLEELLALLRGAPSLDEPLTARALTRLARMRMDDLESADAVASATAAVEVCRRVVERDADMYRPLLIAALESLHIPLYMEGKLTDASAAARELATHLRSQDPAGLPDHPVRLGATLWELAGYELKQGNRQAAIEALRESVTYFATIDTTDPTHGWKGSAVRSQLDNVLAAEYLFRGVETAARGGLEDENSVLTDIPHRCSRDDLAAGLTAYALRRFEEQRTRQAGWTGPTINDAIDRAFAELNQCGIVALQDAGPTMAAGWENVHEVASSRNHSRGAVFYHRQDLERALDGGGLYLAYGAFADDDQQTLAVGHEVRATLGRHGVPVEWNGSTNDRLRIPPFEWRKRR
jgi:tetratricopeptide (TPR) repeat protein